jgi:glucosamine--fructose-6-phosphate aminotransferase (isomerizing)
MCGIVGIIGHGAATPRLIDSLRRLEYRGYDSAGVACVTDGVIHRRRAQGKLANLEILLAENPLRGGTGIGHTRWATHGVPNEINAHPHATKLAAVVHNGIIENFGILRAELTAAGHHFETETDSEAIVQLVSHYLAQGDRPEIATAKTLARLDGAFALAFLFAGHDDLLIAARKGSPLAIGYGDDEMYIGSDALALAPLTRRIAYLLDGDWAVLRADSVQIFDEANHPVVREIRTTAQSGALIGKDGYRHFMHKEIHEQPQVIGDTLNTMLNPAKGTLTLPALPFALADIERITIIACGTSYYAGLVAKYWIESLAAVPVDVDVASEFRYRAPPMTKGGLAMFISQSGETADTLAALRYCRDQEQKLLALVNVAESTIARESDVALQTFAGPEIGVASTKAFTTQLTVLACLAVALARAKGTIDHLGEARLCLALSEVPARAAEILAHDQQLQSIAEDLAQARDVLYLGRGSSYPIALEGALKLKEISYIHAEGYAAGELKHGPIALIDDKVPVIVLAPSDALYEKTSSNVQEVAARGGKVIFLSDRKGVERLPIKAVTFALPDVDPFVAPILYHVAVAKGTDVDQPRNLAKSVTVE